MSAKPLNRISASDLQKGSSPTQTAGAFRIGTEWWIVGGLTLLAGILRFWKLGHASLWGDEINFVNWSFPKESLWTFFERYPQYFLVPGYPVQLPLPMILTNLVLKIGSGEFVARIPAALFGTLTVPIMYLLGRRLMDSMVGLISAALTCLSFFLIYYSREAYFYSPLVFFCCAFWLVLMVGLEDARAGRKVGLFRLLLIWLCGACAFLSHLLSVFFIVGLGGILFFTVGLELFKTSSRKRFQLFKRNFLPLVLSYVLCWPVVAYFLWFMLKNQERPLDYMPHRAIVHILNLPFQMGWGNFTSYMAPAAAIFCLCLLTGLFLTLKRSKYRPTALKCLWMVGITVAFFLKFQRVNFFTLHYLILVMPPLLLLAAIGIKYIAEKSAARLNWANLNVVIPLVVVIWLAAFEVRPLTLLYEMSGKPTDWKRIAAWMNERLPKNSIVFFDWHVNVGQHVPAYYNAPNIHCTYTLPVNSVSDVLHMQYRDNTRAVLEKYSDAAYFDAVRLFDSDPRIGGRWEWPSQYFRQRKSFKNSQVLELDRLGLYPKPIDRITWGEVDPVLYWNTREDHVEIHKERGAKVFRLFGRGFGYVKTTDYRDWRTISNSAVAEIYNLGESPLKVRLQLNGVALSQPNNGTDKLQLLISINGSVVGKLTLDFQRMSYPSVDLTLPQGRTDVDLTVVNAGTGPQTVKLLVDDLVVKAREE